MGKKPQKNFPLEIINKKIFLRILAKKIYAQGGKKSLVYIKSSTNFKTFNRAKFRNDICNENWEFLAPALDLNQMWTEWKTKFLQIVDEHAPIRIKRVRSKNSPWITAHWKQRMHNRDTLNIKAIKSNDRHDWANFKRMRNKVNTEIKAAKELFYNNKFTETNGDQRKTWQIIHDLTSRKAANLSIREINLNGTSISESSDLSNAFNDHFSYRT